MSLIRTSVHKPSLTVLSIPVASIGLRFTANWVARSAICVPHGSRYILLLTGIVRLWVNSSLQMSYRIVVTDPYYGRFALTNYPSFMDLQLHTGSLLPSNRIEWVISKNGSTVNRQAHGASVPASGRTIQKFP